MKMQALSATGSLNSVLDLVGGDRLIAQIAPDSRAVSCFDVGRQHERLSPALDALQDAGAEIALGKHRLGRHEFCVLRAVY